MCKPAFRLGATAMVLLAALALGAAGPPGPVLMPDSAARLDAALQQVMTAHALPSVLLDIDRPGHAPYRFIRGPMEKDAATSRRAGQPFRIASLTKTFTATAVLILADQHKLQVSDPISRWFPDFPNSAAITVDDLLRMRSGIAAPSDKALGEQVFDHPLAAAPTLAEQMDAASRLRAQFTTPGQTGVYLNLNYDILGGIIERVSGQNVGAFVTQNIIRKLGLHQTTYPHGDVLPGGLHGYGRDQAGVLQDRTRLNPALAGAAGAMIASADDLRRYVRVLCTGGLLTPETQTRRMQGQALAGSTTDYGQGLITGPQACGHSGSIPGFSTDMYYFPEFDTTVIASINRLDRDDELQTIPVLTAAYDTLQAELQPAGYCRRIGAATPPRPITDALQPSVRAAFGLAETSAHGSWRCDGGHVLACVTGANLPCGKIDPATSSPAGDRWCRTHPDGDIPAFVTSHDTEWRWACVGGHAEHGSAAWALNADGYARELWRPVS